MNTSHAPVLTSLVRASSVALLVMGTLAVGGCADVVGSSRGTRMGGVEQYNQGAYTDAAGSFRNAVRQDPRDYQSYYYLGASYEQLGQYHQAIQSYKTSLDTQQTTLQGQEDVPFRMRTIDGLASAIAKSPNADNETDVAEQRAREQQTAESALILAKIHRNRGDVDSALDAYNRAALLEPDNFHVNKDYGLYLEQIGQQPRAEVPLKRAYRVNRDDAEVLAALQRLGIIPGPSLLEEQELAGPPVPKGPLPEVDWSQLGLQPQGAQQQPQQPDGAPVPSLTPPAQTVQAPRD